MLGKQANVARVEPLGFVEVTLAPIPLASPSCDIGQRFRNPAAISTSTSATVRACRLPADNVTS